MLKIGNINHNNLYKPQKENCEGIIFELNKIKSCKSSKVFIMIFKLKFIFKYLKLITYLILFNCF